MIWVSLFLLMQPPTGQFFRYGTDSDFFIEERITCMLRSQRGLMWFGTQRGLVRFDGIDTLHFRGHIEDSFSIPTDNISSLAQTDPDFLWVGTQDMGVFQFDLITGKRRLWRADKVTGTILSMVVDGSGQLWAAGSHGLWRFSTSGDITRKVNDRATRCLTRAANGGIWQAGNDYGLYYINPVDDTERAVNGMQGLLVRDLLEDEETLWLAADQGLYRVDRFRAKRAPQWPLTGETKPLFYRAQSLARDHFGTLWVGGNRGLWRRRSGQRTFEHFKADLANPAALRNNLVNLLLVDDHHQLLWLATQLGGVDTYQLLQDQFHLQVTHASTSKLMIHKDFLWVAKLAFGADRVSLNDLTQQTTFLQDYRIAALTIDADDAVWFATNRGMFHLAPGDDQPQKRPLTFPEKKRYQLTAVHRREKNLWVGTRQGLYHHNLGAGKQRMDVSKVMPNKTITVLEGDAHGRLWVGTFRHGLTLINTADGRQTHYRKMGTPSSGGLSNNSVLDCRLDARGLLWIATMGGLNQLDPESGKITYFTMQSGFPDNAVTALTFDQTGKLWANTGSGLVTPRDDGYTILRRRVEQFNIAGATTRTGAVAPDGRVFFGGTRGWVAFDPNVVTHMKPPRVLITGIDRDGSPIAVGRPPALYLGQEHESLEIEWTTVDYNQPRYNLLRARIGEGGESRDQRGKWRARFTSDMSWGRGDGLFSVQVEGENQRGFSTRIVETVRIQEPWWKRWWWLLLGSFFLISYAAGHTVVQARTRKKQRELEARVELAEEQFAAAERKQRYEAAKRKLQEEHFWMLQQHLDQVSTQIAHDLHDGPLAELSGMGFRLHALQQADLDEAVKAQLADLTGTLVPRISHELRNVCSDLLVPDFDMSLALEVESFAENMAERYPEIELDTDIADDPAGVSAAVKSTLYRIARTLLQNVAKHAHAGKARLDLSYSTDQVQLVVSDDGVGFAAPQAWDQLKKEKHYGLYMSHYFANALGGDLVVHSQIGEGTRIEVNLPKTEAARMGSS
ncbi:sensor histidine kinase [Acanthopleuribacter pedis]|uniref:Histidine kinase domain-containing protein n=1 Tax=Acanthopleuribacter pedis TaxID=442870 RepID=A0A8J7Q6I2_9BACT|nr:ATP-binding protein [Acanthopleuribacter pedis]MBO1319710.1 hypothetical protein [Acanthopleuribacter pedis]